MLPNAKVGDSPSTGGPGGAKRVLGSGCRVLAYSSQSVEGFASTQHPKPGTRQGWATEAARAAPEYAFDAGLFRRIYARTDVPNSASVPAMERLGMKVEREREEGNTGTRATLTLEHPSGERLRWPRITASKPPCFQYLTAAPPQNPIPQKPVHTSRQLSQPPATPAKQTTFHSRRPIAIPFPPARRARLKPGNSTYPPLW